VGWNTWHISDGTTSSHPEWFPSLFDANNEAKPAYYAVQAAMEAGEPMSGTPTSTPAPTQTPAPTSVPTPTPSPGTGKLYVEYRCATTEANSKRVNPHLIVYNTSAASIPLTELTMRYWYTSEVGSNEVCEPDYVAMGPENIETRFLGTGPDHCIEIGFTSGAGGLSSSSDTGPIQMRIHDADWQYYDQSDDYSFDPVVTDFTKYDRVTLYHNGGLIRGTEPATGSTSVPAATPEDVNGDGTIDIIDALLTAQYYVGLNPENFNPDAADADCNGGVDIVDALLIAQFYVGLISAFC
jgi:hypothetical protein